nr:MAG TPA: hypothetical protein [Caudoviricetes sp.]
MGDNLMLSSLRAKESSFSMVLNLLSGSTVRLIQSINKAERHSGFL